MIRLLLTLLMTLFISLPLSAQQPGNDFEGMLFDSSAYKLEEAIREASQKHAIYSYNVANASTPGFQPILFPEDRAKLESMVPMNNQYFSTVVLEHMTTQMQKNSREHAAFYALYRKKLDNFRQVATLGKK